jgi:hypothetical protein
MADHEVECPLCHGVGHVPPMVGLSWEGAVSTWVERHRREDEREAQAQANRDQITRDSTDP